MARAGAVAQVVDLDVEPLPIAEVAGGVVNTPCRA